MFSNILFALLSILAILGAIYSIYWGYNKFNSGIKKPLIIAVITSAILIPSFGRVLYVNAGEIIHPTPFLKLDTKKVQIKGVRKTGTLTGKTLPNAKVQFKDPSGIFDTLTVTANNSGNFKISNLENYMDYKVTAIKDGKKSNTQKISVSDIPTSAYTKFKISGSDDSNPSSIEINSDDNNKISVHGTSSPNSIIRIEDQDNDYKLVKKIKSQQNGKWSVQLDGPKEKKEIDYYLSAKVKDRFTNYGNTIYVTNPNYKKPEVKKNINNSSNSNTDNSQNTSSDYPDITSKFDINNMSQYSDDDLFVGVTLKNFYVKSVGADSMGQYHLLLTPDQSSDQYFLVVTKSKNRIAIGDKVTVECGLNGKGTVNNSQIKSGIDSEFSGKNVILTLPDKILVSKA